MTISMYEACVPTCVRALTNLDAILDKAMEHVLAADIDPSVLINWRLYPDMFPFVRQVQIATDIACRGAARLAGEEPPSIEDTEKSFPELKERIRHVLEILESYRPEQIDGSEQRTISFPIRGETTRFDGQSYLLYFVLPNVFFHVTTAYNILRHNGVPLGKRDFLGSR